MLSTYRSKERESALPMIFVRASCDTITKLLAHQLYGVCAVLLQLIVPMHVVHIVAPCMLVSFTSRLYAIILDLIVRDTCTLSHQAPANCNGM